MTHEIYTYASWCNDGSADLMVFCRCGAELAVVNAGDAPGELTLGELMELAAKHVNEVSEHG